MRKLLVLLWALLPAPAFSAVTPDALRDLVMAGDIVAVEVALADAVAQDAGSGVEPDIQRGLFDIFVTTHPNIDAFTAIWLKDNPTSAYAMAARARYLYAVGWALRSDKTAMHVYPAALDMMKDHHTEAYGLAQAAIIALPNLIAASDTLLKLTPTLGKSHDIPLELERVFALHSNRGSLMRAMVAVSPQWGGRYDQLILLCERYAPQIKTVPNYDAETCQIDGVYFGSFWDGEQREAAHQVLMWNANPVLDYARLIDVVDGYGPPEHRIDVLTKLQAERPLTVAEGYAFDAAMAETKGPSQLIEQVEQTKALPAEIAARRLFADRDPHNPYAVLGYVHAPNQSQNEDSLPFPDVEIQKRLRDLLTAVPTSGDAWSYLGEMIAGDPRGTDGRLDRLATAEPYLTNGVAYTNADAKAVLSLIRPKIYAILDLRDHARSADISGLSSAELKQLDDVVHCPLVWQLDLLRLICTGDYAEANANQCNDPYWSNPLIIDRITDAIETRDACWSSSRGMDLIPPPIKFDP